MEKKLLDNEKIIADENTECELTEKDLEDVSGGRHYVYRVTITSGKGIPPISVMPFMMPPVIPAVYWRRINRVIASSGILL